MPFFFVSVSELGRVERCGNSWVATDFFIFNFVPLFPVRSWLHVAAEPRRRIPLHLGSVAIAYARVVPLALAVAALVALPHPVRWLAVVACLALAALAYTALGRMSATEKAKRWLTAEFIGAPVALHHVRAELGPVRQSVDEQLSRRLAEIGAHGYRGRPSRDVAATWDDPEALRYAFVLARIDVALAAASPEKKAARELEQTLWDRLTLLRHNATELEMGRSDKPSPVEPD